MTDAEKQQTQFQAGIPNIAEGVMGRLGGIQTNLASDHVFGNM